MDHRFSGGRSPVSVRLDLAYGSSSFENFGGNLDLKLNSIYGMAYALLHPNIGQSDQSSMDLYVGGGGGFVNESIGGADADGSGSSTNGALSGVVGGAAPIGSIFLFFEGRWVLIFSEGSTGSVFRLLQGLGFRSAANQ